jgi:tRNA threonylcarbamoyladenosine biosynthesis protein TsaE
MAKDSLKRWGPVFVWAGLIFTVSAIPTLPKVGFLWWDFTLKKSAHMLEYGILMYLLVRARLPWHKALIYGVIYALSDEIHQRFVTGRSAKLTDVGFDTVGMLAAGQLIKARWRQLRLSRSAKQTQNLAAMILAMAAANQVNVISVKGEMGAGKTTLIQGMGRELGLNRNLPSPTFILIRSYQLNTEPWKKLYHVDLYRLKTADEMRSTDLAELWQDRKNLVVVEWAERAEAVLPQKRVEVEIKAGEKNNRQIQFKLCG